MKANISPETIMTDFEKSIHNAVKAAFPSCSLTGCLFHLCQNFYRKLVELGLKNRFETDVGFHLKFKYFSALAFLPPAHVQRTFHEFCDAENIPAEFLNYLEMSYIGGERIIGTKSGKFNPTFPIEMWNM